MILYLPFLCYKWEKSTMVTSNATFASLYVQSQKLKHNLLAFWLFKRCYISSSRHTVHSYTQCKAFRCGA